MIKYLYILVLMIGSYDSKAQVNDSNIITFDFCATMLAQEENSLIEISIIYNGDTLLLPKVGKNKFISPVTYYNIDTTNFYKNEDGKLKLSTILFENTKYVYEFLFENIKLKSGKETKFCVTGETSERLGYNFEYGIQGGIETLAWGKRKEKVFKNDNKNGSE